MWRSWNYSQATGYLESPFRNVSPWLPGVRFEAVCEFHRPQPSRVLSLEDRFWVITELHERLIDPSLDDDTRRKIEDDLEVLEDDLWSGPGSNPVPAPGCGCGIYAIKDRTGLPRG